MDDNPLRCDGCFRESWPEGSLVLHIRDEDDVSTVRHVRVSCGAACAGREPVDARPIDRETVIARFAAIGDVFDYADRLLAVHDWDRGTVQRLSRVLAELHRRRGSTRP